MESFLSFSRWVDHATAGLKGGRKHRERAFFALPPIQTRLATPSLEKSRCAVKTIPRNPEPQIRVPQTQSAFHRLAERNASRRRHAHQRSRLFAPVCPALTRSPNSNRAPCDFRR